MGNNTHHFTPKCTNTLGLRANIKMFNTFQPIGSNVRADWLITHSFSHCHPYTLYLTHSCHSYNYIPNKMHTYLLNHKKNQTRADILLLSNQVARAYLKHSLRHIRAAIKIHILKRYIPWFSYSTQQSSSIYTHNKINNQIHKHLLLTLTFLICIFLLYP